MEGKKNILVLVSRFLDGGIDTVLVEYLNNLSRLTEHKVTLAIMLCMDELEVYRHRISQDVEVKYLVDSHSLTWYKQNVQRGKRNALFGLYDEMLLNPIRRRQAQRRLDALAKENDVVIDFDSCFSSFVRKEWKARKIAFFHFSFKKELERKPRRIKRFRKRISKYDRVVTISDAMLEEGRELFPEYSDKFARIYNSVNPAELERKAECDINASKPYLLAVERLEENQKDISNLIDAYAILRDRMGDNAPLLYLIGKGKDEQMLRHKAMTKGLGESIVFLGFQSNPYPWIKNANIIVHSAKFEGLPTVLIESLLLGKLIISTDCPTGPSEILNQGKAGVLVPVGNSEAFADAMGRVLSDKVLQGELLAEGRKHRDLFLPENNIRLLERLF
ncbi:MAG: glycosyltransferase [Bacteroidaceae bacterium]|nr:glycosyltransferase [Bacteroidaceae bacterium]